MVVNHGKVIELFLTNRLRLVSIKNWTGRAFAAYRKDLKELLKRDEISKPGVYFLVGEDDERTTMYIGETEDFSERIQLHSDKEWDQCIVFNNIPTLNKAHVKWLERKFYDELTVAGRVSVQNKNTPNGARLTESGKSVMEEYKELVYIVLGTLGFMAINEKTKTNVDDGEEKTLEDFTFILRKPRTGIRGEMKVTPSGYKVLKGAILAPRDTQYLNNMPGHYARRARLKDEGKIVEENENMVLKEDQMFKSPSGASMFIYGKNSNGRTDWKTEDGESLNEIEKKLWKTEDGTS